MTHTKDEYIDPSHVDDLVRAQGRNELLKAQNADLLEALKDLMTADTQGEVISQTVRDRAYTAIAKAEGRQP